MFWSQVRVLAGFNHHHLSKSSRFRSLTGGRMGPGPYSLTYSRCLMMLHDAINKIANFASIFRAPCRSGRWQPEKLSCLDVLSQTHSQNPSKPFWETLCPFFASTCLKTPHLSHEPVPSFYSCLLRVSAFFPLMFQTLISPQRSVDQKSATGTAGACQSRPEVSQERMAKGKSRVTCNLWFMIYISYYEEASLRHWWVSG